jgi:hypothetical protein
VICAGSKVTNVSGAGRRDAAATKQQPVHAFVHQRERLRMRAAHQEKCNGIDKWMVEVQRCRHDADGLDVDTRHRHGIAQ